MQAQTLVTSLMLLSYTSTWLLLSVSPQWLIDCSTVATLPDLAFTLGGKQFKVPASAYIIQEVTVPMWDTITICIGFCPASMIIPPLNRAKQFVSNQHNC